MQAGSAGGWDGSLFSEHRARPGLLAREIAWRWTCGLLLLTVAGYAGWHVWLHAKPALQATGIFAYERSSSVTALLADPAAPLTAASAALTLLAPPAEHALLGLLPFAIFCWCMAFGFGRSSVLRHWDPTLPARPLMLATAEALRIGIVLLAVACWFGVVELGSSLMRQGAGGLLLMLWMLLLGVAIATALWMSRIRQALAAASVMALVDGTPLSSQLQRAWAAVRQPQLWPLRRAVRRTRLAAGALVLVLTLVPSPFALGWASVVWWGLLSVPPLIVADAWRLGAIFALLRVLRSGRPAEA